MYLSSLFTYSLGHAASLGALRVLYLVPRSVYCTDYQHQCVVYVQSSKISALYSVPRSVYCTEYPDQCVVFSTQISVLYRVPSPLPWPDQCIVQSTQPAPMVRSVYCTEYPVSVVYMHRVPRSVYCICTEYPDQCVVFSTQISVLYRVPSPLPWPDQCIVQSTQSV